MFRNRFADAARKNIKVVLAALLLSLLLSGIYFIAERNVISSGVLIPWRSAALGFAGFTILFWFAKEKRLAGREKDLFSTLSRDGRPAAALMEGICQAALAAVFFLLFYMLCRERWNLFFIMFFGVAALICSVALSNLEPPPICRRILSVFGYCVLLLYFIYNLTLHGYTALSEHGVEILQPVIRETQGWIHIGGVILVIAQFRTDVRRALAVCLIGVILYFVWMDSGLPVILEFAVAVLLSNLLGKPGTIAKVILTAMLVYVACLACGIATGWVEIRSFYFDYAGWVSAYGMGHSNLPALLLMTILLLVWYLWMAERPVITAAVFWAAAAGIWFMTYCRTVVIVLAVFPLTNLLRVVLVRKKAERGLIVFVFLPLIFGALSVAGMFWIPTQKLFPTEGNFFLRFTDPYRFVQEYGITLFGTTIRGDRVIDDLFLHLLLFFGVASVVVICGLLTWVGLQHLRNRQYAELIILAILMFYSLMENALVRLPFGFAALLIGCVRDPGRRAGSVAGLTRMWYHKREEIAA